MGVHTSRRIRGKQVHIGTGIMGCGCFEHASSSIIRWNCLVYLSVLFYVCVCVVVIVCDVVPHTALLYRDYVERGGMRYAELGFLPRKEKRVR